MHNRLFLRVGRSFYYNLPQVSLGTYLVNRMATAVTGELVLTQPGTSNQPPLSLVCNFEPRYPQPREEARERKLEGRQATYSGNPLALTNNGALRERAKCRRGVHHQQIRRLSAPPRRKMAGNGGIDYSPVIRCLEARCLGRVSRYQYNIMNSKLMMKLAWFHQQPNLGPPHMFSVPHRRGNCPLGAKVLI